ncbi:MAG: phage portal protein [Thermoguttaceae bacterium]|nr:phage portal protein [Thermoguttaceae bacterium]
MTESAEVLKKELEASRSALLQAKRDGMLMLARYEGAQNYDSMRNHWLKADGLSPDAANSASVRRVLRNRSRYEFLENASYAVGAIQTVANDMAGSGLRIRIQDETMPKEIRNRIERRFTQWQHAVQLRKKIWQMRVSKIIDGETFAVSFWNPQLSDPVKIDWKIIEADCITDPLDGPNSTWSSNVDGIRLDEHGIPTAYHILKFHPGGEPYIRPKMKTLGEWVPADRVCHWFKPYRTWHRGIPELTASLPLCAIARRYTYALLKCMELQASLAAVLETELSPYAAESQKNDMFFDTFPIESGMFTALPAGQKMKQLDRVPVGPDYDAFQGALNREIFRPLCIPFNMLIGSSHNSNMASGVLDAGIYTNAQKAERFSWEEDVGRKIVRIWYEQGIVTEGYFCDGALPQEYRTLPDLTFQWDSVTIKHTDPTKEMNALAIALSAGLKSTRDVQETYFNKDIDEYRADLLDDAKFQLELARIRAEIETLDGIKPEETEP